MSRALSPLGHDLTPNDEKQRITKLEGERITDRAQIEENKQKIEDQITQLKNQTKTIVDLTAKIVALNSEIAELRVQKIADEARIKQLEEERDALLAEKVLLVKRFCW